MRSLQIQGGIPEEVTKICEQVDHTGVKAGCPTAHKMAGWMMVTGQCQGSRGQCWISSSSCAQSQILHIMIKVLQKRHNGSDTLVSTTHFSTPK